jgi:outer membrane receptor protein involved in Fe transport
MLRVTRSHDIRASSPLELNPNSRTQVFTQADPKLGIQYLMPAILGGNPNLTLEQANTFTVGAVFKPAWIPRFRLSVDFYDIKVNKAIDIVSIPLAVTICRAGTFPGICTIGRDANGNPDRILQLYGTYQNVNQLRARGLEIVSNYSFDLADLSRALGGTLNFTINGNYVDTLRTTLPDGSLSEFAGVTGNSGSVTTIFGVPRWRADAVITYEQPAYSITTQFRYIPRGILNRSFIGPQDDGYSPYLANSVSDNRIAARLYVALNARMTILDDGGHKVEIFGGINNLFDKDPPSNLRFTGNGLYFDPIGRAFKFGVRASY